MQKTTFWLTRIKPILAYLFIFDIISKQSKINCIMI
jgi:hypothetical protein